MEKPAGSAPGSGRFQTFEFPVVGAGQGWLQLVYRRPFEKDVAPAKAWSIFLAAAGVAARLPRRIREPRRLGR